MTRIRLLLIFIFSVPSLASHAAQGLPVATISTDEKEMLKKAVTIQLRRQEPPLHGIQVTEVKGYSCKGLFDGKATAEEALDQLRYDAYYRAKVDMVGDILCTGEGSDSRLGCSSLVTCMGWALRKPEETPPVKNTDSKPQQEPVDTESQPQNMVDKRIEQWGSYYADIVGKARSKKLSSLYPVSLAAKEKYFELFPEERGNPYIAEYFAYMAVLAEKVDLKKLTFAEAEYQLTQKQRELSETLARATREAQQYQQEKASAAENAKLAQEAAERQRQEMLLTQQRQQQANANAAMFNMGLGILQLNQQRAMLNAQQRPVVCNWMRTNAGYYQVCN